MKRILKPGWLLSFSLFAGLAIPLDSLENWKSLPFSKIPANEVSIENKSLKVSVNKSSSPLVYKFSEPQKVTGFKVKAKWKGKLSIPVGKIQGEGGADDFILKFGLVESGTETLSWFQKKVAADWILELYKLAPEGTGVKQINFYSTTLQKDQVGKKRKHPLSELIFEERIQYIDSEGEFTLEKKFEKPMESLGIWLSTDGDDTSSNYELVITEMSVI